MLMREGAQMPQRGVGSSQFVFVGGGEGTLQLPTSVRQDRRLRVEGLQLFLGAARPGIGAPGGTQGLTEGAQQLRVDTAAARSRHGSQQVFGGALRIAEVIRI